MSDSVRAQASGVAGVREVSAATRLKGVRIEAQDIDSLFSQLSIYYDIPIGLEVANKEDELAVYQMDLKEGTLLDLLTQFTAQHDQYVWEIKDGVVNIFPKDHYRDPLFRSLLETKISRFTVKKNTSCWNLAQSLSATPEIKKVLEEHGTSYRNRNFSGAYIPQVGRDFTLDLSNEELKLILNKVIKTSPTASFWVITRNSYDQTIFLSLNARHESIPPNSLAPIVFQP